MYIPKVFNVTDKAEILSFIQGNSFGQLISLVDGKIFSSHLPFVFCEQNQTLLCHLAKKNPQWQHIEGQEILVTFQGPHDYVSASWYCSPGVPTWNYQSVHLYGNAKIITEKEKLRHIVNGITKIYESGQEKPWQAVYKDALLEAIVGIEINISDIQCKYKLSQNRPEQDRLKIIEEHNKRGSFELSKASKNQL
ncbi:MAG: FMN-binding negative transcriptional regulator [Gammaproteobacteria bacterium]|nr:FMN-binding negative transcriptional regulator [Gammaproteobacteria bacterium]